MKGMTFFYMRMGNILFNRLIQYIIFIHGTGAVCVDFTEFEGMILLIKKDIKAGNRQEAVI